MEYIHAGALLSVKTLLLCLEMRAPKVSCLACVAFYATCNIWHASNRSLEHLPLQPTVSHKVCTAYSTPSKAGILYFSTFPNIPATMPGLYYRSRHPKCFGISWQLRHSYAGSLILCEIKLFLS